MGKIYNAMTYIYNKTRLKELESFNRLRFYYTYKFNGAWGGMKGEEKRAKDFIKDYKIKQKHYRNALDIGCGYGYLIHELSKYIPEITGIDISNIALDHARKLNPKAHISNASITKFNLGKYDLIVANSVLNYLTTKQKAKAMKNIHAMRNRDLIIID